LAASSEVPVKSSENTSFQPGRSPVGMAAPDGQEQPVDVDGPPAVGDGLAAGGDPGGAGPGGGNRISAWPATGELLA